jgi:hypothetical protein
MPDAIMLKNGDKICEVGEINGVKMNTLPYDVYQNSRTKELCRSDGSPLTALDTANLLGDGKIELAPQGSKVQVPFLGGTWQCTSCNEIRDMDFEGSGPRWRQVGDHFEHKCAGHPPSCGHFHAVRIYPEESVQPGKIIYKSATKEYDPDHIFKHHPPAYSNIEKYTVIRDVGRLFTKDVLEITPPGSDQDEAIKHIRMAVFFANAAIALKGMLFK